MANKKRKNFLQTCPQCLKEFMSCKSDARTYCSPGCSAKSRIRRADCVCQTCGSAFRVIQSMKTNGRGKYCDLGCAGVGLTRKRREAKKK